MHRCTDSWPCLSSCQLFPFHFLQSILTRSPTHSQDSSIAAPLIASVDPIRVILSIRTNDLQYGAGGERQCFVCVFQHGYRFARGVAYDFRVVGLYVHVLVDGAVWTVKSTWVAGSGGIDGVGGEVDLGEVLVLAELVPGSYDAGYLVVEV